MRLALCQCAPGRDDLDGNLARLRVAAGQAAAQKADLLVFPEMYASGYNIGAARAAELAQESGAGIAGKVAEAAREFGLGILYGYPERNPAGKPYNSVQLIDRQGRRRANYRKTHLYGALDQSQFSPSDEPSAVFELEGWKIGLLICFDVEFPETVRRLAREGADLVLVPTANMHPYEFVASTLVPSRAYENQVFLAYANYEGTEGGLQYVGSSSVVAPDGRSIAQGVPSTQLLVADLDRAELDRVRGDFSYLDLRRPALY